LLEKSQSNTVSTITLTAIFGNAGCSAKFHHFVLQRKREIHVG